MGFNLVILVLVASSTLAKSEDFLTVNVCGQNGTLSEDCKCPPNFALLENEDICVMLTGARAWSGDLCLATGTVDDFYHLGDKEVAAVRELILKNASEFWISVRKDGHYGLPRSRLPGRGWGIVPDLREIAISQYGSSGNCLKVDVNSTSAKGKFVDCGEKHHQLCIYRPKKTLLRLYCEDLDELTTRYSLYQDTCFKIESNNSNRTKLVQFVVDGYRKLGILNKLQNQTSYQCSTIMYNTTFNGSTVLNQSFHGSSKNYSSLANVSSCIAYQRKHQKTILPQLNLNYDRVVHKLLLSITNSRFLWRDLDSDPGFTCFSGADPQLRTNVTIKQKLWPPPNATNAGNDAEIYELPVRGQFPSWYWCEGHAVPNFTLVQSQKVVEQKKDPDVHIFATRIRYQNKYAHEQSTENMEHRYRETLTSSKMGHLVEKVHVARIESMQDNNLTMLVHVAAKYSGRNASNYDNSSGIPLESLRGIWDHYQLRLLLETLFKEVNNREFGFLGMNSTEMCFPEPSDRNGMWWPKAPIGQSVTLEQKVLCSIEPGLIPYRKCLGDRIYGGVWESVEKDPKQCLPPANPETKTLDVIYRNSSRMQIDEIEGALKGINDVIRNYTKKMEPMDIYLVSGAIENFRETLLNNGTNNAAVIGNKSTSYYCGLSDVLSHMMNVERSVMNGSQSLYNATNRLLDSTESIINQLSTVESVHADRNCLDDRRGNDSEEQGTMLIRKPKFVLLVADPDEANVTGMALIRTNTTEDHDFDSYDVRLLTMDDSEADTLAIENLEIASFIPRTLLNKMKQLRLNNTNPDVPFRVVISVYFNDRFFQESLGENSRGTNGKIVSVTVPGYGSELPERLPVFVREVDPARNSSCEFWKFLRNDGDDTSRWSPIGCESSGKWNNVNLCKCSHMTSFSRIFLDPFGAEKLTIEHPNAERILDTITLVGCLLSLFGIMGIFITAIVFPRWNDLFNTKILLNLSFAVAIELIVFTFIGYFKRPDDDMWCAVQGALIHYTILVTFMWMLVIAHLQFMQFVKVLGKLRPTHCVLKATIVSWGLPLAPVGFFFFQNYDLYLPKKNFTSDICFPHDQAQFYGLLIPIALILTVNLACFLLIMYHVSRAPDNLTRSTNKNMALLQLRLLVLLFFQLGLSWMFGMMITENAHLVWSYLFCFTAPYQGLMLFVNFILLQPSTRRLWSKKIAEVVTQNYDRFALKKSTSSSQPPMWL